MKAAFVAWQPLAGLNTGYTRRVHELAANIRGMEVTVVSPPPEIEASFRHVAVRPSRCPRIPWLSQAPVLGYRLPPGGARLTRALNDIAPDVVHSEGIWPFPPLRDYADTAGIPLIVTVHNLEHVVVARSGRASVLAHLLRRLEAGTYNRADLLVCMSDNDKEYMQRRMGVSPDRIVVVPNGATPPEIDSDPEALKSMLGLKGPVVLFMGKLDYRPNAEALDFLLEGVLPRIRKDLPLATLVVVGSPEPDRVPPGVLAVGGVPSVWPYVLSSDVCVAPLLSGSGTRLKVLEYMAAGRPVVSTAVGVEGLEVEAGRDVILAETPADFAAEVVRLLRDPSEAAAFARRGRDLVDRRYRWDAIARRYEEELSQHLGTRR